MTKPRVLGAWSAAVVLLLVGTAAFLLGACAGWGLSNTFLGAGLLLDIAGALVLAVPDIPTLHRLSFSGQVRQALRHLQRNRKTMVVKPGLEDRLIGELMNAGPGINRDLDDERELTAAVKRANMSTEGFHELVSMFRENDSLWDHVFGFTSFKDDDKVLRVHVLYKKDGDVGSKLRSDFHNPFGSVLIGVREDEARIRRTGLSLLIIGFSLQGISIIV